MLHIIWSIIVGFIVGLIARAIMPGMQHLGFIATTLLGIGGSIVGGLIARLFSTEPLRLSSAEAAIPMWAAYMSSIPHLHSEPAAPPGVTFRDIDPDSGMLWRDGCPGPWHEAFLEGTAPTHYCPVGILGGILRRVFFDKEHFDEPPAITYDQFRRWADEIDRERQNVEGALQRFKKIFGD